jgi:hypothetical protein
MAAQFIGNIFFTRLLTDASSNTAASIIATGNNSSSAPTCTINYDAITSQVWKINSVEAARISSDSTFRVKGAGTAGSTDAFQVAGTAPADAARIDSSGNLMAGVTSTAFRINATVASGADRDIFAAQIAGASNGLTIKWNHATTTTRVNISNLPTSASGLASGDLWNDGGTLKIA